MKEAIGPAVGPKSGSLPAAPAKAPTVEHHVPVEEREPAAQDDLPTTRDRLEAKFLAAGASTPGSGSDGAETSRGANAVGWTTRARLVQRLHVSSGSGGTGDPPSTRDRLIEQFMHARMREQAAARSIGDRRHGREAAPGTGKAPAARASSQRLGFWGRAPSAAPPPPRGGGGGGRAIQAKLSDGPGLAPEAPAPATVEPMPVEADAGRPRSLAGGASGADDEPRKGGARPAVQLDVGGTDVPPALVARAAEEGLSGPSGRLPYLEQIQKSFGPEHELSTVRAHVGGRAAVASDLMGAHAYATGDEVAFARSPDLHTAAHEAAHVVQQRAGVDLDDGVSRRGDRYERAADAAADRVVAGQPAGALLSGPTGGATARRGIGRQGVQKQDAEPAKRVDIPEHIVVVWAGDRFRIDVRVEQASDRGSYGGATGPAKELKFWVTYAGEGRVQGKQSYSFNILGIDTLAKAKLIENKDPNSQRIEIDLDPGAATKKIASLSDSVSTMDDPQKGGYKIHIHSFSAKLNGEFHSSGPVWVDQVETVPPAEPKPDPAKTKSPKLTKPVKSDVKPPDVPATSESKPTGETPIGDSGPAKRLDLPKSFDVTWGGDPWHIEFKLQQKPYGLSDDTELVFTVAYRGTNDVELSKHVTTLEFPYIKSIDKAKLVENKDPKAARIDIDLEPDTGGNNIISILDEVRIENSSLTAGVRGRAHGFQAQRNYKSFLFASTVFVVDRALSAQKQRPKSKPDEGAGPVPEAPEDKSKPLPSKASATKGKSSLEIWYTDIRLGGYDDQFRVTIQPTSSKTALFGLSALQGSEFTGGGGMELKTAGSGFTPSVVGAKGDTVEINLDGGNLTQLKIVDSVGPALQYTHEMEDRGTDLRRDRDHTITVSTTGFGADRVFKFNVRNRTISGSVGEKASDTDVEAMANASATRVMPEQLGLGGVDDEAARYEAAALEQRKAAVAAGYVPKDVGTWWAAVYVTMLQIREERRQGKAVGANIQRMAAMAVENFVAAWMKDLNLNWMGKAWGENPEDIGKKLVPAIRKPDWALTYALWDNLLRKFDDYLLEKGKKESHSGQFRTEKFEPILKGKRRVEDLRGKKNLQRLAAVFYPDPKYRSQGRVPDAIPLSIYYWREESSTAGLKSTSWQLRDYTDPDRDPQNHDVADNGKAEPPVELFEQLDHKSEYPKGIIKWAIPGGSHGSFHTTEKETTGEKVVTWLGRIAMVAGAVGLALTGVGALLDVAWLGAAGSVVLFASATAGVAAATGDIMVKARQGTLTGLDLAIDIGQIVASLAAMGQIPAGHFIREGVLAEEAVVAGKEGAKRLTGWAAQAAAVSSKVYIPLKYANIVGDTITVLAVSASVHEQLSQVSKLPEGEREHAYLALMATVFLTAGMSLVSINGASKEIVEGVPNIIIREVNGVPTAFFENAKPKGATTGGQTVPKKPAEPAGTKPVEPPGTTPVEPGGTKPVEPEGTKPVEPEGTKPVEPAGTKPVEPEAKKPAESESTKPAEEGKKPTEGGKKPTEEGKKPTEEGRKPVEAEGKRPAEAENKPTDPTKEQPKPVASESSAEIKSRVEQNQKISPAMSEDDRAVIAQFKNKVETLRKQYRAAKNSADRTRIQYDLEEEFTKYRGRLEAIVRKVHPSLTNELPADVQLGNLWKITIDGKEYYGTIEALLDFSGAPKATLELGTKLFTEGGTISGAKVEVTGGLAGTGAQGRVNPFPGDVDLGESIMVTAKTKVEAGEALAQSVQKTVAKATSANEPGKTPVIFERIVVGKYPKDHPSLGNKPISWSKEDVERGFIEFTPANAKAGDPPKKVTLAEAFTEPGDRTVNTFWKGPIDEAGTYGEITKVMRFTAQDLTGKEFFSTPRIGQGYQEVAFGRPQMHDINRAYLLDALEPQIGQYSGQGNWLKAAKRAYTVARMKGDTEAMDDIAKLLGSKNAQAHAAEEHAGLFFEDVVHPKVNGETTGQASTAMSKDMAMKQARSLADQIEKVDPELGKAMRQAIDEAGGDVRGNQKLYDTVKTKVLDPLEQRIANDADFKFQSENVLVGHDYLTLPKNDPNVVAANRQSVVAARAENLSRNEAFQKELIASTEDKPVVADFVLLGGGPAAVTDALTMGNQGRVVSVNDGKMTNPWEGRTQTAMGQRPIEYRFGGAQKQARDFQVDPNQFTEPAAFNDAVAAAQNQAKLPIADGKVVAVEDRPTAGWGKPGKPEAPDGALDATVKGAKHRVEVELPDGSKRYIYSNHIDMTGGPGGAAKLDTKILSEVNADTLVRNKKLFYGEEALDKNRKPQGDVLVYGGGASGGWVAEGAQKSGANVLWDAAEPKLKGEVPWARTDPTTPEGQRIVEARKVLADPNAPKDAKAKAAAVLDNEAFKGARLRRNTSEEEGGALSKKLNVKRKVKDIKTIEPETVGGKLKVKVTFADGEIAYFDEIILSIGQDVNKAGSANQLLGTRKLVPIEDPSGSGQYVGAQTEDKSIRVLGASAVTVGRNVKTPTGARPYGESIASQSKEVAGVDSKGIDVSIHLQQQLIEAANQGLIKGGSPSGKPKGSP